MNTTKYTVVKNKIKNFIEIQTKKFRDSKLLKRKKTKLKEIMISRV